LETLFIDLYSSSVAISSFSRSTIRLHPRTAALVVGKEIPSLPAGSVESHGRKIDIDPVLQEF
jgi:hypothetical protein